MSDINSVIEDEHESDHWISVADLMAGLMVIFLFIAISSLILGRDQAEKEKHIQAEQAAQIEILQKQIEPLQEQIKDLETQIKNLEEEKTYLETALADTTGGQDKLIQVKQVAQIKTLKEQIQNLEEEKEQLEVVLEDTITEQAKKEIQIETLKKEKEQLENVLEDTITDQTELAGQIQNLEEEKQQLESTLQDSVEQKLEEWKQKIANLVKAQKVDNDIYLALEKEFKNDLPKWQAELSRDLTIRFKSPDILFDSGEATLKPKFKEILRDFIPRYLRVLKPFEISIEEIRIEGHTSSEWKDAPTVRRAYFNNMELSQDRTRAVLEYSLAQTNAVWSRSVLTANGLSSSRLIKENGVENAKLSRRVEFKIRTKVKQEILKAVEELQ